MDEKSGIVDLSPRELEVARAYSGGASYREIAERLFIAPTTVRTHLSKIYRKLGVSSKVELFRALEPSRTGEAASAPGLGQDAYPDRPSIAVLPFSNFSGDPDQEYFADGLTEDITTRLACLRDLLVIARTSTFAFKGRSVRVQDAASDLGVRYILEGSVRKAGDRVRIKAQLIDGRTGGHIWAETYDRNLTDVFEIQDAIAHAIVVAMQIELTDGHVVDLAGGGTQDLKAWEVFQQGVLAFLEYTKEKNLKARELYARALDLDRNFADAKVCLAWTYWQDARCGWSEDRAGTLAHCRVLNDEIMADGEPSANAAHLNAATLLLEGRHSEARSAADTAVALGPSSIFGYTPSALAYIYAGDAQSGLDLLRTNLRLSPFCPADAIYNMAYALSLLGRHEDAVRTAAYYARRVPSDLYAYTLQAIAFSLAGNQKEAQRSVKTLRGLFPSFTLGAYKEHELFLNGENLERVLVALQKAGLPQ